MELGGRGGALLNEFTGLGVDGGEGADILQGEKSAMRGKRNENE
jgi:hypothetical protein